MHGKMVFKYNHLGNRILEDEKKIICLYNEANFLVFFLIYITSLKDIQVAK